MLAVGELTVACEWRSGPGGCQGGPVRRRRWSAALRYFGAGSSRPKDTDVPATSRVDAFTASAHASLLTVQRGQV